MKKLLVLLLTTIFCFAQKQPQLDFKIDAITWSDSIPNKRVFKIDYHLENLTSEKVKFIGYEMSSKTKNNELRLSPKFRLYQNKDFLNVNDILSNFKSNLLFDESIYKNDDEKNEALKKYLKKEFDIDLGSETKTPIEDRIEKLKAEMQHTVLNSIITFEPKEIKKFSRTLYWHKKTYYKQDDNEYFFENASKFYIEMFVNFKKEDFKSEMSDVNFEKLMKDKTISKGVYFTPKVEINFNLDESPK